MRKETIVMIYTVIPVAVLTAFYTTVTGSNPHSN